MQDNPGRYQIGHKSHKWLKGLAAVPDSCPTRGSLYAHFEGYRTQRVGPGSSWPPSADETHNPCLYPDTKRRGRASGLQAGRPGQLNGTLAR